MAKFLHEVMLRKRQVLAMTGWSKSTLYNRIAKGQFKRGVRIGSERTVGWPQSEVDAYLKDCIAARDSEAAE